MTNIVGIIPAGGNADRFHGLAKELLPVSADDCALTRVIRAMRNGDAGEIYIASRHDRVTEHYRVTQHIKNVNIMAFGFRGLWDVIAVIGEKAQADFYYFAMADTVFPLDTFARDTSHDVTCGAFYTDKPSRFGILGTNRIVDKSPDLIGDAWGVWIWTADAMEFLVRACRETQDHTAALNKLLGRFGLDIFWMAYYYDFASFDDYAEFLCSHT